MTKKQNVDRKGGDKAKGLMQQQLSQLRDQVAQLDKMIQRAKTPKEVKRFRTWKRQLNRTLRKAGQMAEFKVTPAHRKGVIDYIKGQPDGKRGPWLEFARAVGVSATDLGTVVREMLNAGTISEPSGKGSMVYVVIPVNGRGAAKTLYIEQRAEDSPKADVVSAA